MLDSISVNVGYDEDIEKIKDYMKNSIENVDRIIPGGDKSFTFWVSEVDKDVLGTKLTIFFNV